MKLKHVEGLTVAAHRGDCYHYYENTMTAFEEAWKCGADMIETDVHMTLDRQLILMHDHTVDRTTNGKGTVSKLTLTELQSLNAGDALHPEKIPLFEDFMAWACEKGIMVNIEIKEYYSPENEERCAACIDQVIACVEKYQMADRIVINSFDAWVLEYVYQKFEKRYLLHGFYPYSIMRNVTLNPDEYLYCACIFDDKNPRLFSELEKKGIEPWIGAGVTQESRLQLCCEYGAKLITTNNPTDVLEKLKRLGKRHA